MAQKAAGAFQQHMEQLKPHVTRFDNWLSQYPALVELERVTRVPKIYTFPLLSLLTTLSLTLHYFAGLTTALIGTLYPSYRFFEAAFNNDVEKLKTWGTYFVVLGGLVNVVELGERLWTRWFPFYWVGKVVVLGWLMVPQYMGARMVYDFISQNLNKFYAAEKAEREKSAAGGEKKAE
ncbi:ER membrane protein DP1/Yop1 [Rhizophlyctis rosea]|nr:ER membrane protein DP1/Yop1 [Rhizophlyctis rosea]